MKMRERAGISGRENEGECGRFRNHVVDLKIPKVHKLG